MKRRQWNRGFPDVPVQVHQTVLDTLEGLGEQEREDVQMRNLKEGERMKKRKLRTRTMALLAAALVVVLVSTVAAAELFRWNEKAGEIFEAEPEIQSKLVMEEIAVEEHQSVADNGLTVTAVQTIQDSNCFYALFEVKAEDAGIRIDEDCSMDYLLDFHGGQDPFCAMGWGFVDRTRQEAGNSRYFEIFGTKMEESGADLNMGIHFTALRGPGAKAMDGDVMISGDWNFELALHPAKNLHIDVKRDFQIGGCQVLVESVDLSPLTCRLTCNGEDIWVLAEKEGVNFDQLDELLNTRITGVVYEDGRVIEQDGLGTLWERYPREGSYERLIRFERVIEPEKVSGLLLGENRDEIILR